MTKDNGFIAISVYTSEDAVEDGILVDLATIDPKWEKGLFRYVTTNLLSRGYMNGSAINVVNLVDLLNQALQIVKKRSHDFTDPMESFYDGDIELPSGSQQSIFIEMNEHEKYTILLPEDH